MTPKMTFDLGDYYVEYIGLDWWLLWQGSVKFGQRRQSYIIKTTMGLRYCCSNVGTWTQGGTLMARGGIRLVYRHTKSTLITYLSGMKIDPKNVFLHAFFLICPSCQKHTLFSNFARFCTSKRCTRVQCLVLKTFKCPPNLERLGREFE